MRERGLKHTLQQNKKEVRYVVPLAGTWIETRSVAVPATGKERSFPLRERGLKLQIRSRSTLLDLSFPSWERGLKRHSHCFTFHEIRRSPRGNVD